MKDYAGQYELEDSMEIFGINIQRVSWNLQFQSKQAQNVTRNKEYKVLIFFKT
jgi:hypothetical protein